mmetsp:Transcript_7401/g.15378  ORF Transcript_7401/g.15378 Transcript_7401/m.15378 type:complete len:747 (+) Transcript_7401:159-2399(+)
MRTRALLVGSSSLCRGTRCAFLALGAVLAHAGRELLVVNSHRWPARSPGRPCYERHDRQCRRFLGGAIGRTGRAAADKALASKSNRQSPRAAEVRPWEEAEPGLMRVIKQHWGHDRPRPHQREVLQAAIEGRDAIAVLHTGYGKSLCYQAPALLREGVTIVISPLISLMKDQVDALQSRGISAAYIASTKASAEVRGALQGLREGRYKLFYVAPERLLMDGFRAILEQSPVEAFIVDEAHCIISWGSDFRSAYKDLGHTLKKWDVPVHAFTATATMEDQDRIQKQLKLNNPLVVLGDMHRPNLHFRVLHRLTKLGLDQVMEVIAKFPAQSGIIYCLSKQDTESLCELLTEEGVICRRYHAGLPAEERDAALEEFTANRVHVVVATVAFGMGIDKPDVRFVVHASLPLSLTRYVQETGRAGRDGKPSDCVLLTSFSSFDFGRGARLIQRSSASERKVKLPMQHLHEMAAYAAGTRCRQNLLQQPFAWGTAAAPCGNCDICCGDLAEPPESAAIARTLLTAVLETGERFGLPHVIKVVRGNRVKLVKELSHTELPCFGTLKGHSEAALYAYLEQLAAQGFLRSCGHTQATYLSMMLTEAGRAVLAGDGNVCLLHQPSFDLTKPKSKASKKTAGSSKKTARSSKLKAQTEEGRKQTPSVQKVQRRVPRRARPKLGTLEETSLGARLQKLRLQLARRERKKPYLIFHDTTLWDLILKRPQKHAELLSVYGIGEVKASKYGAALLDAIAKG